MAPVARLAAAWLAGLSLAAGLGGAAQARAPLPRQLAASFTDRLTYPVTLPPGQSACKVQITALEDRRRDPSIVAVLGGMAVKSPPDAAAWLKLVMAGLNQRGFAVEFTGAEPGPAAPDTVRMKVRLQTVWLSTATTNFLATAVLHVAAARDGAGALEHDYRGAKVTLDWAGGTGEMQRVLDYAFTEALNAMTPDLLSLCAGLKPAGAG